MVTAGRDEVQAFSWVVVWSADLLATSKDIRQDCSGGVIDRMPQPPLVLLFPDKAPHFIHLGFPSALNGYSHFIRMQDAQQGRIDRLQRCFFLFQFTQDSVRTDP
jgi:hypothetical protein